MTKKLSFDSVEVGDDLPSLRLTLSNEQVRDYAVAADMPGGRFFSDEAAQAEGLPGQIVPGNLSLALFSRLLGAWGAGVRLKRLSATFRALVRPQCAAGVECGGGREASQRPRQFRRVRPRAGERRRRSAGHRHRDRRIALRHCQLGRFGSTVARAPCPRGARQRASELGIDAWLGSADGAHAGTEARATEFMLRLSQCPGRAHCLRRGDGASQHSAWIWPSVLSRRPFAPRCSAG